MQALRITTDFGSFRKKSWQWHKIARNKIHNLLVLVILPSFYIQHFFHNFKFSEEIAKSKSIILTSYFNTLIFKFNRFKRSFQVAFENFFADRWYQPLQKHQRHLLKKSNSLINFFRFTKFSKGWKVWPKTHFLVFVLFVRNFSNKHHYNLLKILRIFCLRHFCPKWLFPKLIVFKVDLCIKVVALIKITTIWSSNDFPVFLETFFSTVNFQFPIYIIPSNSKVLKSSRPKGNARHQLSKFNFPHFC